MDMMQWIEKGYELQGTRTVGTYIASKNGKYGVLKSDFFGTLHHDGEWFATVEEAHREAVMVNAFAVA